MTGTATAILCVLSGSAGCALTCLVAAGRIQRSWRREKRCLERGKNLLRKVSQLQRDVSWEKELHGRTRLGREALKRQVAVLKLAHGDIQEDAYDEEETTLIPG